MPRPILPRITLLEIKNRTGRMSEHPLYDTWRGIIERCYKADSASYSRYGRKGITVYPGWVEKKRHPTHKRWSKGFCAFLDYVELYLGEKPKGFSLDRINTHGNYEPNNLRWADASLQKKNQKIKNSTGYKYVYAISNSTKWQGEYKNGSKRIYVGAFETKEQAYFAVLANRLETMWPEYL